MRAVAVGLLVLAAVVYVATLDRDGALGFVNAGAEASMVGAIADWFAVTALFRHPLGLPIPHTALVPKRKDELGKGLEEFVGENFLQEEVIRERVGAADDLAAARRSGSRSRRTRGGWSTRSPTWPRSALRRSGTSTSPSLVEEVLIPRFREEPIAPLLGGLLSRSCATTCTTALVDLALEELHRWLVDNPETSPRCSASARRGGRRRGSTRR